MPPASTRCEPLNRNVVVAIAIALAVVLAVLIVVLVARDDDRPADEGGATTPSTQTAADPAPPPGEAEVTPEAAEVLERLEPRSTPTQRYEGAPPDLTPEPGGRAALEPTPAGDEELVVTRADGSRASEVEFGPDGRPTEARYFDEDGELELVMSGARALPGRRAAGGANPSVPLRVRCGSSARRAAPWRFTSFPQRWKLNVRSVPRRILREGGLPALRRARATWIRNRSHCRGIRDTSRVRFRYTGGTRRGVGLNGISSIGFGNTATLGGVCPGTVACTLTWVSGRRVIESDTRFNSRIGGGFSVPRRSRSFDLQSVMTHELGHTLGLEHVNSPANVMYPFARRGDVSARRLGRGDALLNNGKY